MKTPVWISPLFLVAACSAPYTKPPEPVPGQADTYRFSISYDVYSSRKSVNNTALYVAEQLKAEHDCERFELDPVPGGSRDRKETEFVVHLYC